MIEEAADARETCTLRTRIVFGLVLTLPMGLFVGCASTDEPTQTSISAIAPPATITSEATQPTHPSAAQTEVDWATLARPLHLSRMGLGKDCPRSTGHPVSKAYGPALGDGPVYPIGLREGVLSVARRNGRYVQKVLWVSAAEYQGPVLIRGARLDGPGVVRFAAGNSEPSEEFRLLESGASSPDEEPGWREWPSYTEVAQPGCYAYQVDGTSFSTVLVFEARVGS
jgi:hypothetical protein